MQEQDKISIIIPAYNVEKYIRKCVESLFAQTYKNYEVIIVDDGSTDHTKEICHSLVLADSKLRYFYQKNSGVSAARNSGIQHANGKWVVFLDADDYMDPQTLEKAVGLVRENGCDTICWNCYAEGEIQSKKYPSIKPEKGVYTGDKMRTLLIEALYYTRTMDFYPGQMFRAVWGKMLLLEKIKSHGIYFPLGLSIGEDAIFLADYFKVSSAVLIINEYWNHYRVSSLSAVGKYKENIIEIQEKELFLISARIQEKYLDRETIFLNQYIQFDCQYVHNLCKKESRFITRFIDMWKYIKRRKYAFKHLSCYDKRKIRENNICIAWAMVCNFHFVEASLCVLREWWHRSRHSQNAT